MELILQVLIISIIILGVLSWINNMKWTGIDQWK